MKRLSLTRATGSVFTLVAVLVLGLSGCQTTEEPVVEPPPATSEFTDADTAPPPVEPETPVAAPRTVISIAPVYFDFDKSDVQGDSVETLKTAARLLGESGARISISGHCDNRGSEEYNLALGERRAAAVRRYLSNLGVPLQQMNIVSYGELRPSAEGNTESAWALNRRAEFELAD